MVLAISVSAEGSPTGCRIGAIGGGAFAPAIAPGLALPAAAVRAASVEEVAPSAEEEEEERRRLLATWGAHGMPSRLHRVQIGESSAPKSHLTLE